MTLGQRHARVYQFSLHDQFVDTDDFEMDIDKMDVARGKVRAKPAVVLTSQMRNVTEYMKSRLVPGVIYGAPADLIDAAAQDICNNNIYIYNVYIMYI